MIVISFLIQATIAYAWLTTSYSLKLFSTVPTSAIRAYINFMNRKDDNELSFETANQKTFPVICDDAFMKKLEVMQRIDQHYTHDMTLDKLIKDTCVYFNIKDSELYHSKLCRSNSKIRAVIAWLAMEFKLANITMVAILFNRDHSTISKKLNSLLTSENINELNQVKKYIIHANLQA